MKIIIAKMRHRLVPLAGAALLAACSGGGSFLGGFEDLGGAIVDGVVCGIGNCKPSTEVATQDVVLNSTATQTGSQVRVEVRLGQARRWAILQLAGNDRLTATIGGRQLELRPDRDGASVYKASFDGQGAQPQVSVSFHRDGQTHTTNVTLPPGFAMLSPRGAVQMQRDSADLDVVLQLPSTARPVINSKVTCTQTNNAYAAGSGRPPFELQEATATQQRYRLKAADLEAHLNGLFPGDGKTSPVPLRRCELKLEWALQMPGSQPTGLSTESRPIGEYAAPLELNYDFKR